MPSGIYTAYSGADASLALLEVVANNLANSDTAGFRRDQIRFDSVLGNQLEYARAAQTQLDLAPGAHRSDGNPLHAAIDGPGFFAIEGLDGETRYTRRGDFRINPAGELVLPGGELVLGTGGALTVPAGTQAALRGDGSLVGPAGVIGQLRIVEFGDPQRLLKAGDGVLTATQEAEPGDVDRPRLAVGFVETSNVNIAGEMVSLILAQRSFEANMNSLRIHDAMSESVIEAQR